MKIDFSNTTKQAILNMLQDREDLYYSDISPVDLVNCKNAYDSDFVIYSTDINEGINGTNTMLSSCNDNSDKLVEETETVFSTAQQFDADYVQKIETDTETTTRDYFNDLQKLVDAVAVKSLGNTREEILYNLARYSGTNIFESSDSFSNYLSDVDGSVVFDKDEYIAYDANGEMIYAWDKLSILLTKDPYLLTKEEFEFLVEVVKDVDIEDIDRFIEGSTVQDDEYTYLMTGSDTAIAVLMASEYSLYGDLMSGELDEQDYVRQLMLVTMMENSCSEYWSDCFDYRYRYDSKDEEMYSTEYSSIVKEEGDSYHSFWNYKYDWDETVRYNGCGATANLVVDVNERAEVAKQNIVLNSFISNTVEAVCMEVLQLNPVASVVADIGIGVADDLMDTTSSSPQMGSMVQAFQLHVIETESYDYEYGFGKIKTETTSNVYPSYNTQNEVDNFNSKINSIRDTYVNGGDIPLCGNALEEVSRNDNGNEFYTLETDENGNVYITDIKNITVYDIMNCPNKVNELYYLVTLM